METNKKPLDSDAERFQSNFDLKKGGCILANITFDLNVRPEFSKIKDRDALLTFLADSSHKFYLEIANEISSRF